MNYIPYVIIIVLIFGGLGFVVYSNNGNVQQSYDELEDIAMQQLGKISEVNDAGDVVEIFKGKPTLVQETTFVDSSTGQELTQEEFIAVQTAQGNKVTEEDIMQMTIEGGESYGFTAKFDLKELPESTYQVSNPVLFSGVMKKVIEGSCKLNQDTQVIECNYIDPSKFSYTFSVSCDHREFCNLSEIFRYNEMTNNDGSWSQKIQTNPSDFTPGEYLMKIEANSQVVNPATDRPYLISAEKVFYMVNSQ